MNKHKNNLRTTICGALTGLMLLAGGQVYAQRTAQGHVVDESGFPIAGAIVTAGSKTATTDNKGRFRIEDATSLRIEMPGYMPQILDRLSDKMTVTLKEDDLQRSLSTPAGIRSRFGMASAVSTIQGDELNDEFVSNAGRILSGKLPGLTVEQTSGEPGNDSPVFYIRGLGSWNTSKPLIYVDGFEAPMDRLSPTEIESISVLKDAGALAQFGIKGANGVIWITTKRGSIGKPKVKVSLNQGWQEAVSLPKFIDSYTYASLYNEAVSNDLGRWNPYYTEAQLNAYKNGNDGTIEHYDQLYPNVNWHDEVLRSFTPATNADVSFSGGSKTVRYFLALGYQNIDGLYKNTDKDRDVNSNLNFQKFNYRANIDARLGKIFDVAASVGGDISDRYTPNYSTETLWTNMVKYPANAFPARTPGGYGGTVIYPDNPIGSVLETGFRHFHYRNVQATVTIGEDLSFITKGLRLTETISLYNHQGQYYYKTKDYQRFAPYISDGALQYSTIGTQDTDFTISNTGNNRNAAQSRLNTEIALTYEREFGKHRVSGSFGYHGDKYTIEGTQVPTYTRGFSGHFNYSYDSRYFAEIGYAVNGMSPYSPKDNIGWFPSLSLAWVASNEKFLKENDWIDYLKVRGSVGLIGMADLETASNYFMYQQYYKSKDIGPCFGWEGTAAMNALYEYYIANPDASWEKLLRTNIGIDGRFFSERLNVSIDVFYDRRYDILTKANVPEYFGILSDTNINQGKTSNRGVEISLDWSDRIGEFSYYVNPIFSFARNKIINMNEAPTAYAYQRRTGHPIGTFNVLQADGLFQSWDEINAPGAPQSLYADVQPGDIRYMDLNKDGYIDDNDIAYQAGHYTAVPEITYGITLGAAYKGFDLKISGYGAAHRTIGVMNTRNNAFQNGTGNVTEWALERWAYYPEQGIDTRKSATYPRLSAGSNTHNWQNSTFWLRNGNFFRLSDITLGYTLPRHLLSRVGIDKIRLYFTGTNLCAADHLKAGDTEVQTGYPLMRTFKIGLNLNF